jgi:presequence protease
LKNDSRYFEKLLIENLIQNNHRSIVTVSPDQGDTAPITDTVVPDEQAGIKADRDSILFDAYQAAQDSKEDIERIPVLLKKDIPEKIDIIQYTEKHEAGLGSFLHGFYTAGISYTDLFYDISGLDEDLKIYIPLFSRFIRETGLPGIPYFDVSKMQNLRTGGFYVSPEAGRNTSGKTLELLAVHFKSLTSRYDEAADFIFNILSNADFDDLVRLKDILREMTNDYKASAVRRGNYIASVYASKDYAPSLSRQEMWTGITQLFFLQSLNPDDKKELEAISVRLKKIRNWIVSSVNVLSSLTADEADLDKCYKKLLCYLPAGSGKDIVSLQTANTDGISGSRSSTGAEDVKLSCIIAPTLVSYNSAVIRSSRVGSDEYIYEKLLSRIIETGYLWDKVRMDGGAYGVGAVANGMEGVFSFSSYRDPRIEETQKVFIESLKFIASENIPDEILLKAVISGVGKEIRPLAPGEKGIINVRRKLYGLDDSFRQRSRDIMLKAEVRHIRAAAESLLRRFERGGSRCVLTGPESYEKYRHYFPEELCRKIILKI